MERRDPTRPLAASPEERVLESIREGYRVRDAALIASAYAEEVECTIVNRNHPPSNPLVLRGREALQRMLSEICAREMTHEVAATVTGEGTVAFRISCRYPDGCRVDGITVSTLRDGKVVREFSVDCWDE